MRSPEEAGARYYEVPALRKSAQYRGEYRDMDEAGARAKFAELCDYFGLAEQYYDLPPYGLVGTTWKDPSGHVSSVLAIGVNLLLAKADNTPRSEFNCWGEAARLVRYIEHEAVKRDAERRADAENAHYEWATERQRYVYFIAGETGPVKIGVAVDPQKRLSGLQTSHPIPLAILAVTPGSVQVEREYHQRFAAHRVRGEWFTRAPEIVAEIERLAA